MIDVTQLGFKFALLLGYESSEEWSDVEESFTQAFVSDTSQKTLVSAYQNAMNNFVEKYIETPTTARKIINNKILRILSFVLYLALPKPSSEVEAISF